MASYYGTLIQGFFLISVSIWHVKTSDCHYYGYYFDNTIEEDIVFEDVDECEAACQDLKRCRYWTYDVLTGDCFLKHAYNGEPLLRPHLDMISGPRNCYGYDNQAGDNKKEELDRPEINFRRKKNIVHLNRIVKDFARLKKNIQKA